MDNRPVGVFDSGLGGLTAVREFEKMLPNEKIVYFGDTGRMPYGVRPAAQIKIIAEQNLAFVGSQGVKAMIAACGTISSTADDALTASTIPVFGVLKPGVAELCASPCQKVGVIATATSIKSGAYERAVKALCPEKTVMASACQKFVTLIESGHSGWDDAELREAVEEYLTPMRDEGVGALLLGCTHFGLIAEAIDAFFGGRVELVDAAEASARALARYLRENGMTADAGGADSFFTSGGTEDFQRLGKMFLGRDIACQVRYVPPLPV